MHDIVPHEERSRKEPKFIFFSQSLHMNYSFLITPRASKKTLQATYK